MVNNGLVAVNNAMIDFEDGGMGNHRGDERYGVDLDG